MSPGHERSFTVPPSGSSRRRHLASYPMSEPAGSIRMLVLVSYFVYDMIL